MILGSSCNPIPLLQGGDPPRAWRMTISLATVPGSGLRIFVIVSGFCPGTGLRACAKRSRIPK